MKNRRSPRSFLVLAGLAGLAGAVSTSSPTHAAAAPAVPANAVTPAPAPPSTDGALAALADGRGSDGLALLRKAAEADRGRSATPALLCLLGRVEHQQGDEKAAVATTTRVPLESPCGRQAAFTRADALLALGQADAAAELYDRIGAAAFGDDRDAALVDTVGGLADRVLAQPDGDRAQAAALIQLMFERQLSPAHRAATARKLARAVSADKIENYRREADTELLWALTEQGGDIPADRLLYAEVAEPAVGLRALSGQGDSPAVRLGRALAAWRAAPVVATPFAEALLTAAPNSPEAARMRALQAHALVSLHRASAALPLLATLIDAPAASPERGTDPSTADAAADAAWASCQLLTEAGRTDEAIAAMENFLRRFPAGTARPQVEAGLDAARLLQARTRLMSGDRKGALQAYDALVSRDPRADEAPGAAYEAGLCALAAGDAPDARRRFQAVIARWPATEAAQTALTALARNTAFDEKKPDEALAFLRAEEANSRETSVAARAERERLAAPAVSISVPHRASPRSPVTVRAITRNLPTLEVRLHRVDAEAYLRAGGTPEALGALDAAVIAPDKQWKLPVPGYEPRRDQAFDVPVTVPGPGYYVVTLAGPDRAASTVLLVSDLDLVARTAGPDLALAVFRKGKPVAGAEVLIRAGGEIKKVSTDRTGLYRGSIPGGALGLLATDGGEPALLALNRDEATAPTPAIQTTLDLDRPIHLPGDRAAFRLGVRRGGALVPGPWRVSVLLEDGRTAYTTATFTPGPQGTISGELPLPATIPSLGQRTCWPLTVQVPGEDSPTALGSACTAAEGPPTRGLRLVYDSGSTPGATLFVTEPDGRPAVGVPLTWEAKPTRRPGRGKTDATGRLHVVGPGAGLPWSLTAQIADQPLAVTASGQEKSEAPLSLGLAEDRLDVSEAPKVHLGGGAGPVRLTISQLSGPVPPDPCEGVEADAPKAPVDPWVPVVDTTLHGPVVWTGSGPAMGSPPVEDEVARREVRLDGEDAGQTLTLAALPPGRYHIRAVTLDDRLETATQTLEVIDRHASGLVPHVRLKGAHDAVAGETLPLSVEGGAALVTAEGGRIFTARVVQPGDTAPVTVSPTWGTSATFTATAPDGHVHARTLTLDPTLHVTLSVTQGLGLWDATARVTDGTGKPARAEVVLSALDEALERSERRVSQSDADFLAAPVLEVPAMGGVAHLFAAGAVGEALSGALLAESAREAERHRAERAEGGRLAENAVAEKMEGDVPLSEGIGGLGLMGTGSGGGGYGAGAAKVGRVMAGGALPAQLPPSGERGRVLFHVAQTDADGRVHVNVPKSLRRSDWHFTAHALTVDAFGSAATHIAPDVRPFLRLPSPAAGGPEDRAELTATAVNPGAAVLNARLRAGADTRDVTIPPGEARTVDFGPQVPGAHMDVALLSAADPSAKAGVLDGARFDFPLAEGAPDAQGPVVTIAVGPGGTAPVAYLALQSAPHERQDAALAAQGGLAALSGIAALPAGEDTAAERAALLARATLLRSDLRPLGSDALDLSGAAAVLRFLVAAQRAGLEVVRGDIDAAVARVNGALPSAADAAERIRGLRALAEAGATLDEGVLDRLVEQAATLPDEAASELALTLKRAKHAESKPDAARAAVLVRGKGPQAVLAARALGLPGAAKHVYEGPPPAVTAPDRADTLEALWAGHVARRSGRDTKNLAVRIDGANGGEPVGELNPKTGGVLHVAVPNADPRAVHVEGAPDALVWRTQPRPMGDLPLRAQREPQSAGGPPLLATDAPPPAGLCGGPDTGCRLAVGDALRLAGDLVSPAPPAQGGLAPLGGNPGHLVATSPGRYTLAGLEVRDAEGVVHKMAPLVVQIEDVHASGQAPDGPPLSPIEPAAQLALAQARRNGGDDPTPALQGDAAFPPAQRAAAAILRFRWAAAMPSTPARELVTAFETVRELQPDADLDLPEIARIARAYREIGRAPRAVAVWRAGLGAAFVGEAAGARSLEEPAGLLASLRTMRELTGRYPTLPVVADALFQLPERLGSLAEEETLPPEVVHAGITATDLRLMAAAWDREFLALNPDSPRAPEAGFHLVQGLFRLRAYAQAADWADKIARRHPQAPIQDGLLYLEGLARAELHQTDAALKQLNRVAEGEFPQEDGSMGPAESRDDARYAAARMLEARGDLKAARAAYEKVSGREDAQEALHALADVRLDVEPVVRQQPGDRAKVKLRAANLDEIHVRAYRLDLRTIFLRDAGLAGVRDIKVSGVSPAWAGAREVKAGVFPRDVDVELPLDGAGAWLVQIGGGGHDVATLLLRSDLELSADDSSGQRRLQARWHNGDPGAGVEVRAIGGSAGVVATQTDLRGVTHVPGGAAVLAFQGDRYAFVDTSAEGTFDSNAPAKPAPAESDLLNNIDQRLKQQRSRNQQEYEEQLDRSPSPRVKADML